MAKYRKKPVIIDAAQWFGRVSFLSEFIPLVRIASEKNMQAEHYSLTADDKLYLHTLEGDMLVSVGDWVIVGINGEMYLCKPDIFEKTYEKVEESFSGLMDNKNLQGPTAVTGITGITGRRVGN